MAEMKEMTEILGQVLGAIKSWGNV